MSAANRTRLAAALLATTAAFIAGCSGDEETTSTVTTGADAPDTPKVAVQTAIEGFDPHQIYADSAQGVVTIRSVFKASNGPLGGQAGQGSGFVLNEDGEIATNAHVVTDGEAGGSDEINEADEVYVEFGDRNQVPAQIEGFDPNADVALIKVDPEDLDLQPVELGDSEKISVGDPVAAIGSPFGQEQSLSTGIVSATDRSIDSLTDFQIDGAIQTDTSINPGNSGGPLLAADGTVIGIDQQINTTSGGNEGVGFAVPINLVKRSLDQLREDGEAEYPYIGVRSQPLYPQLAEKLDIDAATGSLVSDVTPGGPAEEAGLQGSDGDKVEFQGIQVDVGGDTIVSVDGTELVRENDLSRLIAQHAPGETVTLEIIRDGETMDIDVELAQRPDTIPKG